MRSPYSAPLQSDNQERELHGPRFFCGLLALVALVPINGHATPPPPTRILFIGNSLTYTFDIPGTLLKLAQSLGESMSCDARTEGGSTLSMWATNAGAVTAIDSGNYDYVVLQEFSSRPTIPNDRDKLMYPAVRTLNGHILSHGAQTILYQTWSYPDGDPQHCRSYDTPAQYDRCDFLGMTTALRMGYARIADELNVPISPVGQAWVTVHDERPDVPLYIPGQYHPSTAGAYLSACVHYITITGRSPVGAPYMGQLRDPALAAYLQDVATRTVLDDPWAIDPYGFTSNHLTWAYTWDSYQDHTGTALPGMVISGAKGGASPSVKLDYDAGQTNCIYLGVYEPTHNAAGQGRLFVRAGANIDVDRLVVGKEGTGWVSQDGGRVVIDTVLKLGEQASGGGWYALNGGELTAAQVAHGTGACGLTFGGGRLAFQSLGDNTHPLDLPQNGGVLVISNATFVSGDYLMNGKAQVSVTLDGSTNCLTVAGRACLDGKLAINLAPGFAPSAGQTLTVLRAQSIQGKFDQIRAPWILPGNLRLVVLNRNNSIVAIFVDALADSDGNGLPDWWELQYLGSTHSGRSWTNSTLNDGIPDGVKFALDVNPTVPANVDALATPGCINNYPTLTYRQIAGGRGTIGVDYTVMGLTYMVELKDDLLKGTWQSGTNAVVWTGDRVDNGDGTETVTVQSQDPINSSRLKFLRLVIKSANHH